MREDGFAGDPWLERVVRRFGFGWAAERLPGDLNPLVLYAVAFVVFDVVVLQGYQHATGRVAVFVENPLWLLTPAAVLGAAFATTELHGRYQVTVERMNLTERASHPSLFDGLVPDRLSLLFVLLGTAFALVNATAFVTVQRIYAVEGLAGVLGWMVVIPLGYAPVAATFLATYVSVEVLLPRRIERAGVGLYYLDPEELGGMRPVGELVKYAYYIVMLGLVAYAVATYGPHVLDGVFEYTAYDPPDRSVTLAFTAVWLAAVGTMVYGIYVLHRHMRREKAADLRRLDEEIRDVLEDPWDIAGLETNDDSVDTFGDLRTKMNHVAATSEYPATFTMWTQVVVGVALPKAIQLVLSAV